MAVITGMYTAIQDRLIEDYGITLCDGFIPECTVSFYDVTNQFAELNYPKYGDLMKVYISTGGKGYVVCWWSLWKNREWESGAEGIPSRSNLPTSLLVYNPNDIPVRIKYMIFS